MTSTIHDANKILPLPLRKCEEKIFDLQTKIGERYDFGKFL